VAEPRVGLGIEPGCFFGLLVEFEAPAEVVERRGVLGVAGEGETELGGGAVAAADVVEVVATEGVVGFGTLGEERDGGGGFLGEERFLAGEVVGVSEEEDGVAVARVASFGGAELADGGEGVALAEKLLSGVVDG